MNLFKELYTSATKNKQAFFIGLVLELIFLIGASVFLLDYQESTIDTHVRTKEILEESGYQGKENINALTNYQEEVQEMEQKLQNETGKLALQLLILFCTTSGILFSLIYKNIHISWIFSLVQIVNMFILWIWFSFMVEIKETMGDQFLLTGGSIFSTVIFFFLFHALIWISYFLVYSFAYKKKKPFFDHLKKMLKEKASAHLSRYALLIVLQVIVFFVLFSAVVFMGGVTFFIINAILLIGLFLPLLVSSKILLVDCIRKR